MWIFLLICVGLFKGMWGSSDSCLVKADYNCSAHQIFDAYFPGSKRELEAACSNVRGKQDCVTNYATACQADGDGRNSFVYEHEIDQIKSAMVLFQASSQVCGLDAPLQKVFLENSECFKQVVEAERSEGNCRSYTGTVLDHLEKRMHRKLEQEYRPLEARVVYKDCLKSIFHMNCYAFKINKRCGDQPKTVAVKIIRGSAYLLRQCPDKYRLDILELANDYKLITSEDIYAKEFLLTDLIS